MTIQLLTSSSRLIASLSLVILLTGCIASIGGGRERVTSTQPTRGQELMDLQKAQNAGAITPEQYEVQKQKILER